MPIVNSEVQHIASLDFDLQQAYAQFEELERRIREEGKTLADLAKANWKIDGLFGDSAKQAEKDMGKVSDSIKEASNSAQRFKSSSKGMDEEIAKTKKGASELSDTFKKF